MPALFVLAVLILASATAAVLTPRLVHAAIALAVGNSAMAVLLLSLQAPHAGVVHLSVGAGVLSALFLVAISLTERIGRHSDEA